MYFKKEKAYLTASYVRLSREDGDKVESDSIHNQRELICDFVKKHDDLKLVEEYIDDGYLLSEDRRSMIIDESVAPIIRNIFQWFLSGMNYQTIADRLNAEGVISPQKHMTKVYGREPNFIVDSIWRGSSIHKLLEKPIYMGKAVRKIGGVDTVIEVPPIVSEEEFLKTQELIPKKPARAITWKIAGVNILNKRIYDKKTGKALMCMKSPIDPNDRVYTLKKNIRYLSKEEQKKSIPYMIFIIPIGGSVAGKTSLLVLNAILGAVFGCFIAVWVLLRALVYPLGCMIKLALHR